MGAAEAALGTVGGIAPGPLGAVARAAAGAAETVREAVKNTDEDEGGDGAAQEDDAK